MDLIWKSWYLRGNPLNFSAINNKQTIMGAQSWTEREIFPRGSSTCLVQAVVTREKENVNTAPVLWSAAWSAASKDCSTVDRLECSGPDNSETWTTVCHVPKQDRCGKGKGERGKKFHPLVTQDVAHLWHRKWGRGKDVVQNRPHLTKLEPC